jgi:serine/threonine protein kinase
MPDVSAHPSAQALALFGHGKLSEAQAATVATHLETCADCRKAVTSLPPDSFVGKVRAAKPGSSSLLPSRHGAAASRAARPAPAAAPPDLPAELASHPKFRIVRELGRGGMGVIYLAEHLVMERPVAIKVISPTVLDNPNALARFQAEVKAAGKLNHQNIARAYDADQAGDLHYLVMEYVEGRSLAQLLERGRPLPVKAACQCACQVAMGLEHAFARGMVHRDIKPHNLMLTPEGQVKILDFGLARMRSERRVSPRLTQTESFMGTPEYVAPEQADDARKADTRSDIYSLGCTLYALLAGRPPFVGESLTQVVLAHIEKEPAALHELRPEVPEELSAVVAKMLAKDPAQRYQRPVEVAEALAPFAKAAGKRAAGMGALVPPPVRAASTATRIGGDTSRENARARQDSPLPAGRAADSNDDSPFADLNGAPSASDEARGHGESAALPVLPWWRRPGVVAVGAVAVLVLILAAVIIKVSVKTADGDAVILVEVDQDGAEVLVDGKVVKITFPGDKTPIEIRVPPDKPHTLEVKKDGFRAYTERIELVAGGSKRVKLSLERERVPARNVPRSDGPPHDTHKGDSNSDNKPVNPETPPVTTTPTIDGVKPPKDEKNADPPPPPVKGDANPLPEDPDVNDQSFVPLFNGRDTANWIKPGENGGMWEIKHGELIGRGGGKVGTPAVLATTRKDFTDFRLRMEVSNEKDNPAQILLRTRVGGGKMDAYRIAVKGVKASGPDIVTAGSIDKVAATDQIHYLEWVAPAKNVPLPNGQRYILEALVKGNSITTFVNGEVVAEYKDDMSSFRSGEIRLVCRWDAEIHFHKIEIKEPKPARPNEQGFVPLFNGNDLTGWEKLAENGGTWEISKDAELVGKGGGRTGEPSLLVTTRADFTNFRLRMRVTQPDGMAKQVIVRAGLKDGTINGYRVQMRGVDTAGVLRSAGSMAKAREAPRNAAISWDVLAKDVAIPAGRPYELEIVAKGNTFTTSVNGKKVAEYKDEQNSFPSGRILLACQSATTNEVRFSKIEIMELPATKPGAGAAAARDRFVKGTKWVGWKLFQQPGGGKFSFELLVEEREGDTFRGHTIQNERNVQEVRGTIKNGEIAWDAGKALLPGFGPAPPFKGKLKDDRLELTFKGEEIYGVAELTLQEQTNGGAGRATGR